MADFSDLSTFDLIDLVNDFNKNFANRKIKMTTNYKYLKEFTISIEEDNLPHLIGLHYVSRNRQANKILNDIKQGKENKKTIKKYHKYGEMGIKDRIEYYPFIDEVMNGNNIKVLYPTENMKPNTQRLSVVFSRKERTGEIVLGLRKDSKQNDYKMATLHYRRKPKYTGMRLSEIITKEWIE